MKKLVNLLKSLSNSELVLVKNSFQKNSTCPKSSLLFNKICENIDFDDRVLAKELYDSPGSSYSHLKRRLKERIIDIIYDLESSQQIGASVISEKAKCHKLLMIASMLIEKGLDDEAIHYLNLAYEVILERHFTAEKFMYHLLLLEAGGNKNEQENISDSLSDNLVELSCLSNSMLGFYKVNNQQNKASDERNMLISDHNPPLAVYYNLFSEVNSCLEIAFFETATLYSLRLERLINQFPKCFSRKEIIKAKIVHARCLVLNKDFHSANSIIEQIEMYKPHSIEYKTDLLTLKWLIAFFTKDSLKSYLYIGDLTNLSKKNDAIESLTKYFNLCLLFQQKNFKTILDAILNDLSLQNSKNTFINALKTLEIYCLIEMGKNELANSKVLAFRQCLKRSNSKNRTRYQFISKVLMQLIKNGFQYGHIQDFYTNYSRNSEKKDIRLVPDFNHYEIITLEDWLFVNHIEVKSNQHLELVEQ